MKTTNYGIQKQITASFEETVAKVKEALAKEGFGVLTEIDVSQTFKKKLNVTFSRYVILGACNPQSAYKALQEEKEIGLLLPCNVVVYEDIDKVVVSAIRPTIAMQMIENSNIEKLAVDVEQKLQKVLERL